MKQTTHGHGGVALLILGRLQRGDEDVRQGKYPEAILEYEAVLRSQPEDARALRQLGIARLHEGELTQAYHFLLKAVALAPKDAQVRLALATISLVAGRADEAREEAGVVLEQEPGNLEARSLLSGSDSARAEPALKSAAAAAPPASDAVLALADFYVRIGRRNDARRVLRESIAKAPDYLPTRRRLANLALAEGDADESLSQLQVVLRRDSVDLDGLALRGAVRLARRETDAAIKDFQEVLRRAAWLTPAHYQLALARIQEGSVDSAKADLEDVVRLAPDFGAAVFQLADLNVQGGATAHTRSSRRPTSRGSSPPRRLPALAGYWSSLPRTPRHTTSWGWPSAPRRSRTRRARNSSPPSLWSPPTSSPRPSWSRWRSRRSVPMRHWTEPNHNWRPPRARRGCRCCSARSSWTGIRRAPRRRRSSRRSLWIRDGPMPIPFWVPSTPPRRDPIRPSRS